VPRPRRQAPPGKKIKEIHSRAVQGRKPKQAYTVNRTASKPKKQGGPITENTPKALEIKRSLAEKAPMERIKED